jgi:hypothetical protein
LIALREGILQRWIENKPTSNVRWNEPRDDWSAFLQ